MKLHACHATALDDGGERLPVHGDRHGIGRDRGREAVREVHLRPRCDAVDDRIDAFDVERVPSDVRDLDRRPVRFARQPVAAALRASRGRRRSGASALPSNSHCMPRQMPSSGRPASMPRLIVRVHSSASVSVAPKWPTPGTTTASASSRSRGSAGHEQIRADRRERLLDRRQISRAVINQCNTHDGNSSSEFVIDCIDVKPSIKTRYQMTR